MSTYWATPENDDSGEPDLHIGGTIVKSRNGKISTEFWLSRPRPEGVSIDEWDRLEQEKWDRIWGEK